MMFRKGSFEIGTTVYPVAIKVRVMSFSLQGIVIALEQDASLKLQVSDNFNATQTYIDNFV